MKHKRSNDIISSDLFLRIIKSYLISTTSWFFCDWSTLSNYVILSYRKDIIPLEIKVLKIA